MAKKTTIRCPHCGWEYLPAEIYYADDFLGKPENIIKTEEGNVLGFDGEDMNTLETYCCDHCGKSFTVDASVTFKTAPLHDVFNDDEEYSTKIKPEKTEK